MRNKLLELIKQNGTMFWHEFRQVMVSDEAEAIYTQMRDIYIQSADVADAKTLLRSLLEGMAQ